MSVTTVLSRISQIDSLVRSVDPTWRGGGIANTFGIGTGGILSANGEAADASTTASGGFSSVLQGVYGSPDGSAAGVRTLLTSQTSTQTTTQTTGVPAGASFVSPLPNGTVTLAFGPTDFTLEPPATIGGVRYAHFHQGLDLAAPLGTPVRAAAAGTVIAAGRATDGAVIVRIRHDDGSETLYGHLDPALPVKVGERVDAGDVIGKVGLTGNTTGPHLHFALYAKNGTPLDPQTYLTAGHLPGAATVSAPSLSNPAQLTTESTGEALARFDAVASQIPYAAEIRTAAVNNGIDPLLLASLVEAESGFQPRAVSSVGAMGLTQLMPATAKGLGVTDPYDPAQNLNGGARYLAGQLKRFGRVDLALAAYQAGPTLVARLGAVPDYSSTKAYIAHIFKTWTGYQERSA